MGTDGKVIFRSKELAGSRLACLALTSGSANQVAGRLSDLVRGFGHVPPDANWMPRGLLAPEKAELGRTHAFLADIQRKELLGWWLAIQRGKAKVPNWDIVADCVVDGRKGLLIVEAKAHDGELQDTGTKAREESPNRKRIRAAIGEANTALTALLPGRWELSHEKHYQLSNRFAWAWKLASLGVPMILVYLGVLGAEEMKTPGQQPFNNHEHWRKTLLDHASGVVPPEAWDTPLKIGNASTPMFSLIRSVRVKFEIG